MWAPTVWSRGRGRDGQVRGGQVLVRFVCCSQLRMSGCACVHVPTSSILVRTFNDVMDSRADPNPIPNPNRALLILMFKPNLKPQTHLQSYEFQVKCPHSARGGVFCT